jgi:hypothetical protein
MGPPSGRLLRRRNKRSGIIRPVFEGLSNPVDDHKPQGRGATRQQCPFGLSCLLSTSMVVFTIDADSADNEGAVSRRIITIKDSIGR